jgi:hypothetical protein
METLEWKDLLLGPPLATSRLVRERLRKVVALATTNGVPAFQPPEARNARRTLAAMGMILGSLFVGVSFLAVRVGVRPYESGNPTLIGQLARWVLGGSAAGHACFYLVQAATLAILVLAANTSFRLPAAGVVRGRRRLPAAVVRQARPAAAARPDRAGAVRRAEPAGRVNLAVVHPPPTTPPAHEFPASRHARRRPDLRS